MQTFLQLYTLWINGPFIFLKRKNLIHTHSHLKKASVQLWQTVYLNGNGTSMTKADTDNALLGGKNRLHLTIDSFLFTLWTWSSAFIFKRKSFKRNFFSSTICVIFMKNNFLTINGFVSSIYFSCMLIWHLSSNDNIQRFQW